MTSEIRANIIKNRVGLGTIEYSNTGPVISGVTTASNFKTGTSNLHSTGLNIQDLDVDGHTNLDNISVAGVSTFTGDATFSGNVSIADKIIHTGDTNTYISFPDAGDTISFVAGGHERLKITHNYVFGQDATGRVTRHDNTGVTPKIQLENNSEASLSLARFSNNTDSSRLFLQKGRGSVESATAVQDNDTLGMIVFNGYNGSGFRNAAQILAEVDGTPTSSGDDTDMPGALVFKTSVDGSAIPSERLRIDSSGRVAIGTDNTTSATGLTVYRDDTHLGNIVNIEQDGTGDAVLGFAIKGTAAWQFGIDNSDSDKFKISYDGSGLDSSTSVTLDRTGKVGIGTNNPLTQVDIYATPIDTATLDTTNCKDLGLWVRAKNPSNTTGNIYTGITLGEGRAGLYAYDDGGGAAHGMGFWTGSNSGVAERLRITSDGKMGLGSGITSPIGNFEIYNSSGISSCVVRGPKALVAIMGDSDNSGASETDASLMFTSDSHTNLSSPLSAHGFEIALINEEPGAGLRFHDGTANAERLRINSTGNMGLGIASPVARLHVHNSGTSAADHAYAHFTTGDTGSTISDGLTVGVAANQVASVNFREAGTLVLNTSSTPRITILSDGKVGINHATPDSQLVVLTDGLADNTYAFKTVYRSGNNASGYTASGISITSSANNSNGEKHTAYLSFSNRDPALNSSHGAGAFITMSTPDSPGTYGTGEFNFYCRNGSAYTFPNDPQVASSYWMSSLFKIKSNGELFGYGNLRIDTGSSADGIIGAAYGTSYFGIKQADQGASEYMMINNNSNTYISCTSGYSVYIRPSANSQTHETIFAHDNTTFKTNVVLDTHALRRNNHHWGHMEGGHNNIGSTNTKTSPIYTIGSAYNPNENDLNNMYGIGFSHSDASFINSNVTGGWGQYVASDGDARIFLNAGDGVVYANRYGRIAHNSGHLQGSYNNVGANSAQSNPIYTIGSSYNPAATTLSNMYGIGYSHGNNASFISFSGLTGWGLYVAADGDARMFLDATTGKIAATGTITGSASDVRLKTNIKVIDNPIEKIKKIRGVTFDWVDNITSEYDFHPDSMHETGVIAQEIQEVIPDAVATAPFNGNYTRKSGTDNNYLTVKNEKIIPLCIEAIKKLTAKVESLEQENTALKARVTSLEE